MPGSKPNTPNTQQQATGVAEQYGMDIYNSQRWIGSKWKPLSFLRPSTIVDSNGNPASKKKKVAVTLGRAARTVLGAPFAAAASVLAFLGASGKAAGSGAWKGAKSAGRGVKKASNTPRGKVIKRDLAKTGTKLLEELKGNFDKTKAFYKKHKKGFLGAAAMSVLLFGFPAGFVVLFIVAAIYAAIKISWPIVKAAAKAVWKGIFKPAISKFWGNFKGTVWAPVKKVLNKMRKKPDDPELIAQIEKNKGARKFTMGLVGLASLLGISGMFAGHLGAFGAAMGVPAAFVTKGLLAIGLGFFPPLMLAGLATMVLVGVAAVFGPSIYKGAKALGRGAWKAVKGILSGIKSLSQAPGRILEGRKIAKQNAQQQANQAQQGTQLQNMGRPGQHGGPLVTPTRIPNPDAAAPSLGTLTAEADRTPDPFQEPDSEEASDYGSDYDSDDDSDDNLTVKRSTTPGNSTGQ